MEEGKKTDTTTEKPAQGSSVFRLPFSLPLGTRPGKRLTVLLAVLAMMVVAGLVRYREAISILAGTESLEQGIDAIPAFVAKELPPVTTGVADWVCWRGPNADGTSPVTGIRKDWSTGLPKLWEINFLCQGKSSATWSAPVVQGNRLVVCGRDDTQDLVFCLNPDTGEMLWQVAYAAQAKKGHGSGPRATPCIDGDRVYTFGRSGDLVCWSLFDGKKLWHSNVNARGGEEPGWGHSASPIVVGNHVILQAGGMALVLAYDRMTGKRAWRTGFGPAGYASPAATQLEGKPAVLVFHGKGLMAVAPDSGSKLWNVPWKTSHNINATTPAAAGNRVFITSGYGTGCGLVRVANGKAELAWRNKNMASHHSDPFIIDGCIHGYSGQSFQNKGTFRCLDLETGAVRWESNDIGWGTATAVDGHLICLDIHGNLYLIKPDPTELRKVTEMPRAVGTEKGPAWTVPVVANGLLYLRFKQQLVCYGLMPPALQEEEGQRSKNGQ